MNGTRFTYLSGQTGLKMVRSQNFGSAPGIFFEILHNERGQEVYGYYINGFSEKILIYSKWAVVTMESDCNYRTALRIFLKFCTMKGDKRYMEIILTVFLKK